MNYISVSEASKKWHISDRRIRVLSSEGRNDSHDQYLRTWQIRFMKSYLFNAYGILVLALQNGDNGIFKKENVKYWCY